MKRAKLHLEPMPLMKKPNELKLNWRPLLPSVLNLPPANLNLKDVLKNYKLERIQAIQQTKNELPNFKKRWKQNGLKYNKQKSTRESSNSRPL